MAGDWRLVAAYPPGFVTRLARLLLVLGLVVAACGDDDATTTTGAPTTTTLPPVTTTMEPARPLLGLDVETVARTLINPVFLTAPVGDHRLFVLEKDGLVEIITEDGVSEEPFLDIEVIVGSNALEQGLLGLAFHPGYESNGRFFIYYTNVDGDSRLVEYRVSADPDKADPESARVLLALDQPDVNHNGGMLLFGPDGYLYVSLGDGGGASDEFGNAQNLTTLLGSIIRLDVDAGDPYAVPPDNPFAGDPAASSEIWAYGLRNPWRIDIDPATGLVYIADVGQDAAEEVSVVPLDGGGGNFGWPIVEGFDCYRAEACDDAGMIEPVIVYPHAEGCSVIGGYVYRGTAIPELLGHYFYGDWCGQWVRSFRYEDGAAVDEADWTNDLGQIGQVQSFGLGGDGEMYVLNQAGFVYRLVPVR